MSEDTVAISRISLQALESRIQQIVLIADQLDILAYEARQTSTFLKEAYHALSER